MQTTANLLEKALIRHPIPYWTTKLKLARTTLHVARHRGNLSPSIAGALAEELGEPVDYWIAIAAIEGDRDSACRDRMIRRISTQYKPLQPLGASPSS